MVQPEYDVRSCQSLLGYAEAVHRRSGGVCQLCDYGAGPEVSFELWRQLTVEHVIGASQGGHQSQISRAVAARFPDLPLTQREEPVKTIDTINTISACHFCNSTTSRARASQDLESLIRNTHGGLKEVREAAQAAVADALEKKRTSVRWKLDALRKTFAKQVEPALRHARAGSRRNTATQSELAEY